MQKDTVEVIINEDGLTCTTVNPFGEKPHEEDSKYFCLDDNGEPAYAYGVYQNDLIKWRQAESERKTYEIANQIMFPEESIEDVGLCLYQPGPIHKARIENDKAIIL